MAKRKKGSVMGEYNPTEEETKAMLWCIDNHIRISPSRVPNKVEWNISIQRGHKKPNVSPKSYGPGEIWEVIYNYYTHYYEKTNTNAGPSDRNG